MTSKCLASDKTSVTCNEIGGATNSKSYCMHYIRSINDEATGEVQIEIKWCTKSLAAAPCANSIYDFDLFNDDVDKIMLVIGYYTDILG